MLKILISRWGTEHISSVWESKKINNNKTKNKKKMLWYPALLLPRTPERDLNNILAMAHMWIVHISFLSLSKEGMCIPCDYSCKPYLLYMKDATPDMVGVSSSEERKIFLECTFLKFTNREQISKSEPNKIIGSTEIAVHSVANDGLLKVQDFIKKYRL